MKKSFLAVLVFLSSTSLFAANVRGTVRDNAGNPVEGAHVTAAAVSATTAADGGFSLELADGTYTIHVARAGFADAELRASAGSAVEITLTPSFAQTMVVSGIRAEAETPVTKSDIPREEIEREYHGQDVPLLLRDSPSINAYAEAGSGGAGYSYISLRGVSPTRINFTLDGVPLSDSEDMGTYFVDFPDLARSLESIQIQRGVGTSTVGTAAFGGSVNLESIALAQHEGVDATVGGGSFGTRQASVGYQSGDLGGGLALYTRISLLETDGFRDSSDTKQHNIFFSGTKQLGDAQLKLTGFSGHERQHLSFYAADEETLKSDLRNNPLSPDEKDSFGYDLAQLQYIRPLDATSDVTASVYYQRGYGWYRLYDAEALRQYGLDGMLLGSMLTWSKNNGPLELNAGLHVNRFERDHTRDNVTAATRDYANYGVKQEQNGFLKATWNAGAWRLYGDAQLRHSSFDYHGDVAIPSISWTFFNPKVGVRRELSPASSLYASAGLSTREPTRNDLFLGEDNASVAHDLHAVRPERLLDLEAGWNHRTGNLDVAANVYAMEFHNEIASTGELSDIGLLLRRNVDRSYRRGVELEAAWQVSPQLRLKTNASASRNRIRNWTQFYDVYDEAGNWVDSRPVAYRNVKPLLTPELIVSQAVEYVPTSRLAFGATGRYVAESFLDNSNDSRFTTPSFVVADANASVALTDFLRLSLQVNNLFNAKRIYPSGYDYVYYSGDELTGTSYYYPQATRNAVILLNVRR